MDFGLDDQFDDYHYNCCGCFSYIDAWKWLAIAFQRWGTWSFAYNRIKFNNQSFSIFFLEKWGWYSFLLKYHWSRSKWKRNIKSILRRKWSASWFWWHRSQNKLYSCRWYLNFSSVDYREETIYRDILP
jgi:hypothetical protein